MTDYFQSILGYVGLHPELAIITAFFVAAGEALLVIGLFVPSTVVLVGIGGLIGLGKLPFWPIFIATVLGAVVGDALSYWAGHIYKAHLAEVWPFSRYRGLLAAGQRYFASHGGKSVFIGRFIPGIKAVIPGIAGMMGMSVTRFTVLNVLSSIAWAAAHLLPGLSAGLALAGIGAISKRLAVVSAILVAGIALMLWFAKLVIGLGARYLPSARAAAMKWANDRHDRFGILVARVVAPQYADFRVLVALNAILIGTIILFAGLLEDVVTRDTIVLFDDAFSQFLQSLRTNWGDHMMVAITMLGDWTVTTAVASAIVLLLVGALHINRGYTQALAFYAPQQKESISLSMDWREGG